METMKRLLVLAGFILAPQLADGQASAGGQTWWCPSSHAYYPTVQSCSVAWQAISAPPVVAPSNAGHAPVVHCSAPKDDEERSLCREAGIGPSAPNPEQQVVAQHLKDEADRGYKRMSFDDFKLDGKILASSETKVALTGFYIKFGQADYLFQSPLSIAMTRESFNTNGAIGLLTDDAARNVRKYFLDCGNNPVAAQMGCKINVLGRASMCTKTTLLGSTDQPCITVEDGW